MLVVYQNKQQLTIRIYQTNIVNDFSAEVQERQIAAELLAAICVVNPFTSSQKIIYLLFRFIGRTVFSRVEHTIGLSSGNNRYRHPGSH